MARVAGILFIALVATNLAWWWSTRSTPTAPPSQVGEEDTDDAAHVARLREEVERLQGRLAAAALREQVPHGAPRGAEESQLQTPSPRVDPRAWKDPTAEWAAAALQTADPAVRAAALNDIGIALRGEDPRAIEAALRAIAKLRELDYDKDSMRKLAQPMLAHEDASVRVAALYAVLNTVRHPGDRDLLLPMARDPSPAVRARMAHVLSMAGDGKITGAAADAVAALLDDTESEVRRGALTGLWGAEVDEAVEEKCLALAKDPSERHDAIYFGLSTFASKSPAVVEALVAALTDPNHEIASRASWGLRSGVSGESRTVVADAYVRLLESRSDARTIRECLDRIAAYGDRRHVSALQAYGARPLLDAATRARVTKLVDELATRRG